MIDLPYSLVIEATDEEDFFGFYSPDLEGFTGVGHSIEDCVYRARHGMKDHVELLKRRLRNRPLMGVTVQRLTPIYSLRTRLTCLFSHKARPCSRKVEPRLKIMAWIS